MAPKGGGRGEAKAEWKAVGATDGEAGGDAKRSGGKGSGGAAAGKGKVEGAPWQNRDNGEGKGKGRGGGRPWQKSEGGGRGGGRGGGYGEEEYYEGGYGYGGGGGGGSYGAGGYGGAYGAAPWNNEAQDWPQEPTGPPPPPAPRLWTEYVAPDGTAYYYNSRTGLTQWDRPAALDPPKPEAKAEEKAQSGDGGKGGRGPRMDAEKEDARRNSGDGRGGDRRREGQGGDRRDGGAAGEQWGNRGRRKKEGPGGGGAGGGAKGDKGKEVSDFGPPGCNLFVFHLPDDWTDDDLNEYFAPHGAVISAKVMKELGTGRSRGFGFVSYEDRVSAATAIKKMQGYKILGKRLKVEFKKGEGQDQAELDGVDIGDDGPGAKKSYPDDERLIGYLRAISAKNVVQSLKESEGAADEDEPGMASSPVRDGAGDEDDHPADD